MRRVHAGAGIPSRDADGHEQARGFTVGIGLTLDIVASESIWKKIDGPKNTFCLVMSTVSTASEPWRRAVARVQAAVRRCAPVTECWHRAPTGVDPEAPGGRPATVGETRDQCTPTARTTSQCSGAAGDPGPDDDPSATAAHARRRDHCRTCGINAGRRRRLCLRLSVANDHSTMVTSRG